MRQDSDDGDGYRKWGTGLTKTPGGQVWICDKWGALEEGEVARLVILSTEIRDPGQAAIRGGRWWSWRSLGKSNPVQG